MTRFLFLFLILLFNNHLMVAQRVVPTSQKALVADTFIGIDNYRNIYFIKDEVIHKQGLEGNFVFTDLQLGRIATVDIINPLKVVVFFEDTNTVVFLDNNLNEIQRFNFNNLPQFLNVSTATNAGNNSLWICNVDTQQLELYNYNSKIQRVVSQPFSGALLSQASNFNYCFILTENSLRAFNSYGSLLNEIPNDGFKKIIQQNENLIALSENELYYLHDFAGRNREITTEIVTLTLPEITIKDLQLSNEFLYIYDGKILHTFKLIPPKK